MTRLEKFEARYYPEPNSGCYLWTGRIDGSGYGSFQDGPRPRRASRVSWEFYVGPIPVGLNVLHRCDNRVCVNPGHLFLGTIRDNVLDMVSKGRHANQNTRKTECRRGHAFTAENTRVCKNGSRICRTCERVRWKREYDRDMAKRIAAGHVVGAKKLRRPDILEIKTSSDHIADLAGRFLLTESTVYRIRSGARWGGIKE